MNTFITILKIASAILFLFLLIPGGKISIPVYLILFAGIAYAYNVSIAVFSVLSLCILISFVFLSFRHTMSYDRISLFILLALYIPVAATISGVFESHDSTCIRSYLIFISVSFISIAFVSIRMIQNKYTDHSSISKPFRKWVSKALMEGELPR